MTVITSIADLKRLHERRTPVRFGTHRFVRKISLLPVGTVETKSTRVAAGKFVERVDQSCWVRHRNLAIEARKCSADFACVDSTESRGELV